MRKGSESKISLTYDADGTLLYSTLGPFFIQAGGLARTVITVELRKELVDLIQEQVEIEKESVARLSETEQKVGTGAARLLLVEMKCDSQKHAAILEAILEALKGAQSSKPLWQQAFDGFADPIIVKREIENHKTLGKSMVAHIQKEMSKTDDEAVRTLLQHLTEDEKRHSEILDSIAQRCYSMIR